MSAHNAKRRPWPGAVHSTATKRSELNPTAIGDSPSDERGNEVGRRARHADEILDQRGPSAWRHEYLAIRYRRGAA